MQQQVYGGGFSGMFSLWPTRGYRGVTWQHSGGTSTQKGQNI